MKRLLLFLAVVVVMFFSCDPSTSFHYEIKNETESDVIVKIGDQESVMIPPGDKKVVYSNSSLGATDPFEYLVLYKLNVVVNDKLTSNHFWQREYWKENRNSKHHFTYLLILTDELIEELLSTEEQ